MTSLTNLTMGQALRRAAVQATLAPSIHNTQPWRFVTTQNTLEIHCDATRRLQVLDPFGRQMTVSCGCAVFNARVSLARTGYATTVSRYPDAATPSLVARIEIGDERVDWSPIEDLDEWIPERRTNRRRFDPEPVPPSVLHELIEAAEAEGAELFPVTAEEHREVVAVLSRQADEFENADPAYRAEMRAWTTDDPMRPDGVPAMAVPHVDGAAREDDVPIRDFDTHGMGWLPTGTKSSMDQCLVLLGMSRDDKFAWLRVGEALERVLLEATKLGYATSPLTQVIEVGRTNAALREQLGLAIYPQILLRVGRAPLTPAVRRRRLVDMLTEKG
jgi:nitroreductase